MRSADIGQKSFLTVFITFIPSVVKVQMVKSKVKTESQNGHSLLILESYCCYYYYTVSGKKGATLFLPVTL